MSTEFGPYDLKNLHVGAYREVEVLPSLEKMFYEKSKPNSKKNQPARNSNADSSTKPDSDISGKMLENEETLKYALKRLIKSASLKTPN
jgi:hypothetical protein